MIKRAYAYLRVSTFQQVDGKSLTGQEEEIRKYCNVYGIELVDVYSDEGKSGKSIEGRPQFQKMLRDIKEKQEVDYVIVWKLSRFGRNACDSLNSLNILQDNGVNLVALTENVDTATPMGRLVFTLLAALAEMERENIREQTANGLKYNALSGGWNGGIPPYGYDAVNKELVINEEEAAVVRKIFEWYLESEEASCDSVTGRLNEEGIKPRHYKRIDRKATEESETDETVYLPPVADWYTSQVKKILDNPTVCGKIRYGYHKTDDGGNKGKQSGDSENDYILVDGKHEAIISEEMWNRAQEKRKKSRKPRGRRDSTSESVNNVFNGIVKCPQCGAHMINYGSRYKRVNGEESYYSTYVCGYWNNHKKGKCRKNPIKTEILEKAVIGGLREYTRRPNLAEEIHQYMEQELDTGKLEKETEELKNKIAALDKNEDMQYKILCQIGVNPTYQNMKPERIQINLDKIATEKKELQEKLDYKMKQIESVQLEKMDFELVKNLLENFNEVYEDAPKELRKRLVRSLIKEVQLGYDDKGKVVPVKMILKFSGEQIELMKEHKENFGLNEAHADWNTWKDNGSGVQQKVGYGVNVYWPGQFKSGIDTWDSETYPNAFPGPAPDASDPTKYPPESSYGKDSKKFQITKWYVIEREGGKQEVFDVVTRKNTPHVVNVLNEGDLESDYYWYVEKWGTSLSTEAPEDGDTSTTFEDYWSRNKGTQSDTKPAIVTIKPNDPDKSIYVKLVLKVLPKKKVDIVRVYENPGQPPVIEVESNVKVENNTVDGNSPKPGFTYVENVNTSEPRKDITSWDEVPGGTSGRTPQIPVSETDKTIYIKYEGAPVENPQATGLVLHENEISHQFTLSDVTGSDIVNIG